MNEPAPGGAAPEPVTETWTYGGIRADKDGKKSKPSQPYKINLKDTFGMK